MDLGTGIKNKLLEAMAAGAPAVATSLACRGLEVRDGTELRIADDDEAFAAAVVNLLREPGHVGAGGREYAMRCHDWDAIAARYAAVYREIARG